MATATAKKGASTAPGRRPRASVAPPAKQPEKISVGVSKGLKAVIGKLAADMGGGEADVVREGIRLLAEARGLPRPPLR